MGIHQASPLTVWGLAMFEDTYDADLAEMLDADLGTITDAQEDDRPVRASMRRSLLKANGRRKGLKNLYNSIRLDGGRHSRRAGYPCHKDWQSAYGRDYRPWQSDRSGVSEVLTGTELTNAELEIIALLEAEYLEAEYRTVSINDSIYAKADLSWFALD